MMRKMLSAVLVFELVFTALLAVNVCSDGGLSDMDKEDEKDLVYGNVYYSADGLAKIFENDTWVCKNITAYCVEEYENSIVDLAIGNEINDLGESHVSGGYDYFKFDPYENQWSNYSLDQEHIAVGERTVDGWDYVFITTFIYKTMDGNRRGFCEWTEWEPIPTPAVSKGDGWINLSIPKFTNPVLASNGGTEIPNANNTIGFAVYRNGTERIENATYHNATHYFYNDTNVLSDVVYHYSVAPIVKGNYTTYGKSLLASSEELSVVLNSPKGGENLPGVPPNNVHTIKYTISGGSPPYNVVLSYSTDGGLTYPNTIKTITHNEEVTNYPSDWSVPEIDSDKVVVRINVTDYAGVTVSDDSDNVFTIDSTPPIVESTIPSTDGSVSIKKPVTVMFREKMNQTATQSAFEISPNPLGWSWTWNDAGDTMTGTHNDFTFDETYTVTITTAAKDLAGNYLAEDHSWNFTANMSVCLNSPAFGDVWTGGAGHGINYTISGGIPNYEVKIYYSYNGEDWSFIAFDNRTEEGAYEYLWSLCPSINSKTVNMKIIIVDGNETESMDTSGNFEIDSTAPYIITYTGDDTYITTTEVIAVVFSEEMNPASVGIGAVQAVDAFGLFEEGNSTKIAGTITWNEAKDTMMFKPNANLTHNMNYTATVNTNATDKSDPGNPLTLNVSWSFIAIEGRGDFAVYLDVPCSPEKGKRYEITVTVSDTGDEAFNISGFLTVKFYASRDTTFSEADIIGTKYIQNIWAGNGSSKSTSFTFDDYGEYYFLVEVTSNNPADTFPGGETGRASASVNVLKPGEEIGLIGPYTLIALMVVIMVIAAALILLSLKKKGELTLKEKKKEEKEEEEEKEESGGEKESEEDK